MTSPSKKITLVGGGLVGSLISIYLARRGYSVTIVESRPDLRNHSLDGGRSINLALSTRGLRALEEVGLADAMKKQAVPMHGRMMHSLQGQLTFQPYGKRGQFINSISRSGLNAALMNEAAHHGVQFLFEHRCVQIDTAKQEMVLQHHDKSSRHSWELLIGADGIFSAVRNALQHSDRFEFSQQYIEDGYKELRIPAAPLGTALEKNALHIWPRGRFMLIALPNPDGSFTCTLFLPFEGVDSFEQLVTPAAIRSFFEKNFADATALMPHLADEFQENPTSSLVTVRCFPWAKSNVLLLGDAAHGIVPFYGQGMNAGFEDCRIFNQLLDRHADDWEAACEDFQQQRKPDADAIAQLAIDNFVEMRDLVASTEFLLRKKIEAKLHELYPDRWIPLYSMVTFDDHVRYSEAYATGLKQKQIMDGVMKTGDLERQWTALDFEAIVEQLSH